MSGRSIILLAGFVFVGAVSVATFPTEAFAHRKGAHHRAATIAPAAVAPSPTTDNGPVADRIPRCFDSVISYRFPPCY
jgi:hypothetical protein